MGLEDKDSYVFVFKQIPFEKTAGGQTRNAQQLVDSRNQKKPQIADKIWEIYKEMLYLNE